MHNLKRQYQNRFSRKTRYRNDVWKILIDSFYSKFISSGSDILDLGCGWGEFINNIEGNRKIGMDLNADAKTHLSKSIEFIKQDCSQEWVIKDNVLDVVFTSNFFEHLQSKGHIEKTIIQIKRCLKPNGLLICMGPNIKHLPGLYWDFWDHYVPLTEKSLAELLALYEFKIEKCESKFLPYTMSNSIKVPLLFIRIYMALPIM